VQLTVIVPAFNASQDVEFLLRAMLPQLAPGDQCIVVDDCSTDQTREIIQRYPVTVLSMETQSGPAAARNWGACHATGDVLVFLDADVVPHADVLARIRETFATRSDVSALMGSYDESPACQATVSKFRNLLHSYTHRTGNSNSSTFWAGCGAIRRTVFLEYHGFDQKRFPRPAIEDVDLGLRLVAHGHKILLDPTLEVQHRKVWSLANMVSTDIWSRAVPWAALILETHSMPEDLSLKVSQQASGIAMGLALLALPLLIFAPTVGALALLAFVGLIVALNAPFYSFLARCGGWGFALRSIPLHWIYFVSCITGFGLALLQSLTVKKSAPRTTVERAQELEPLVPVVSPVLQTAAGSIEPISTVSPASLRAMAAHAQTPKA
jgi:cellulose synthase/poly-beta-1,6-N-acetylglucosamine synthase-like glycosyltransferase